MPVTLTYNPQKKILYLTVVGPLSLEEYVATIQRITHSPEYPPNVSALWDLRKADLQSADRTFFKKILERREQHREREHVKVALIASSDLEYGMSRMFEALSENETISQKLMVFRDYEKGERWLLALDSKGE